MCESIFVLVERTAEVVVEELPQADGDETVICVWRKPRTAEPSRWRGWMVAEKRRVRAVSEELIRRLEKAAEQWA